MGYNKKAVYVSIEVLYNKFGQITVKRRFFNVNNLSFIRYINGGS